jgi:polyphosphate kinase
MTWFLKEQYLESYLRDTAKARELRSDGSYTRPLVGDSEPFNAQMSFQASSNVVSFENRHH